MKEQENDLVPIELIDGEISLDRVGLSCQQS